MTLIEPHFPPLSDDPSTQAVAMRGLRKVYGSTAAADYVSLDIPRGSLYGIVGPNGAGKTTALTMVTGLVRPDAGTAYVAGHRMWGEDTQSIDAEAVEAKRAMGVLIDGAPVFDRLSGREYLSYLGALRSMPAEQVEQRSAELLHALDLSEAGDKRIVDYSAGMTKKILLAGALLHDPEVLILDEPLEAVDPVSGRLIQQLLRGFAERGGTVVVSSHVMELVEGLCDHVAIINQGKVVSCGTVDQVRQGGSLVDAFISFAGGGELEAGSFGWLRGGSVQEAPEGGAHE